MFFRMTGTRPARCGCALHGPARSVFAAALVAVTVIVLFLGPAAQAQEKAPEKVDLIRITHSNGWDALPAVVAQERGFFYEERLVVSALAIDSATKTAESLVQGSTDMAILPQRVFLAMAEAKLPVRAVSIVSWGMPMELVVQPDGPKTLKGLRNRTIAVVRGSDAYSYLVRLLNRADLGTEDVTIKSLPATELTRVLQQKQADAVFEIKPYTRAVANVAPARVLLSEKDVQDTLGAIGSVPLLANARFLERQPAAAQRFLRAWVRALQYIQQNRDDAVRILQIFLHRNGAKVPVDLARRWFEMQRYDLYVWSDHAIADADYNAWALREAGALKSRVKVGPFIDNRFIAAALKEDR